MTAPICVFCGAPERCEVFEAWDDGAFMLDTCCDGMHDAALDELQDDPKAAARWLSGLRDVDCDAGIEEIVGHDLRRVVDDGAGQLLLDWQLRLVPVTWAQARTFIAEHHAHCKPPRGWRFGIGIRNGTRLIGIASVGRPVARGYKPTEVVEVNRCCIRRDIPRELAWNACSMLYGWAAREAKKRRFRKIVTYTLDSELGTSLIAAGYTAEATTRARPRGWDTASRPRDGEATPNCAKTRWARQLAA